MGGEMEQGHLCEQYSLLLEMKIRLNERDNLFLFFGYINGKIIAKRTKNKAKPWRDPI
jgi:hypothetical protein